MDQKERCRASLEGLSVGLGFYGKMAETIRRLECFRACRQVFVSPGPLLSQLRINTLLDGKELIMPSAGLKEGFFLIKPFSVPFKKLALAVSLKGIGEFGLRLKTADLCRLEVGMLVGEPLAVNHEGMVLGDGGGFFDLACAILSSNGALVERPTVCAVIDDEARLVDELSVDDWDVRVDRVVTPERVIKLTEGALIPKIYWENLPLKRVKKITPLWDGYKESNAEISN